MDSQTTRSLTDAIRYWEPRRIAYNAVLAIVVLYYFWLGYPASRKDLVNAALFVFLLAVLANVAYRAAYVVDFFAQSSGYLLSWRRYRWIVFAIGLLFAATLTRFFALGMFASAVS